MHGQAKKMTAQQHGNLLKQKPRNPVIWDIQLVTGNTIQKIQSCMAIIALSGKSNRMVNGNLFLTVEIIHRSHNRN